MSYSLYDGSVPLVKSALASLTGLIKEAEKHASENSIPAEDVLAWRLTDDMLPLAFQVYDVADIAMKFVARVHGETPVEFGDWKLIKTFADAYARIAEGEAWVAKASRETFEKGTDAIVQMGMGKHGTKEVAAKGYVQCYTMPNVFFHLTTAYAILRAHGLTLGKAQFIGPFMAPWVSIPAEEAK